MKEGMRSGRYSGTVVKSRNSSGCLIVRKKGNGIGSSGRQKVLESKKEKKRRLILSDSGSSDELLLDHYQKRAGPSSNQVRNGLVSFHKGIGEETENFVNINRAEHAGGSDELEVASKRSRLDVFEFNEYDGIDGNDMRNEYMGNGEVEEGGQRPLSLKTASRSVSHLECETRSGRHVVDKRKHSLIDSSGSLSAERGNTEFVSEKRFKMKKDGPPLTDSLSRDKFGVSKDEAIRLQGKNGVLKVLINKKNKVEGSIKSYNHCKIDGDSVKGKSLLRASSKSEMKILKKSSSVAKAEKGQPSNQKPVPPKKSKASISDSEDSESSSKLDMKNAKTCSSPKRVNNAEVTPLSEKLSPTRCKEVKLKRGTGTEKQLLREQIKKMLVSAGWTIDYRPRRNRDYLDAVYINPSGTGYWSIVKAYDAFQKQLEDEDNDIKPSGECSFNPISEEVLSKLTRQTRKKIEKKLKNKRRDSARTRHSMEDNDSSDNEDKLSSFMRQNGKSLKGRLREVDYENGDNSASSIYKRGAKKDRAFSPDTRLVPGRKSRKIGRCTLLVRRSSKGQSSESDGYVPYTGKRTLLSWMIDSGVVQLNEKVKYMNRRRTRTMLEGWITKDGIHCGCCSKILPVSKFEIHAGSKLRQPFQNIYLESGVSLLQCQLEAWNKQEESERSGFLCVDMDGDDPNDDTCGICGDGGDLMCCDGCPSTFHLNCLHIQMLPLGDWHCPNCSCKYCGVNDKSSSQGKDATAVGPLLKCSLCEKKYHHLCISKAGDLPVPSGTLPTSFCGQTCKEVCERLQKFLGGKHELEAGFSWSLIHRTNQDLDISTRGFPQRVECNSKLAVALSIMDECFLPIVDRRSGLNLIHNVLYNCGSNFSRLDYSGFYTAILERGDEIISAASIRIHGTQLAEMPFIGTRHIYRRQGMCRRLFHAIESALCSLKVEKLIIPAISDLMQTWTTVFGFNPLEESHKQEMRSLNMLVFPDTDMLQKALLDQEMTEAKTIASTGDNKDSGVGDNQRIRSDLAIESDMAPSADHEPLVCNDAGGPHVDEVSNETLSHELKVEQGSDWKSAEKVAESDSDEKPLSSSYVCDNNPGMGEPVMDSIVDGNFQSPDSREVGDAPEGIASLTETVPDRLDEICAENATEHISKEANQIVAPVSTIYNANERTVQLDSNSHCQALSGLEINAHVASHASSDATLCKERVRTVKGSAEDNNNTVQSDPASHDMEVTLAEINQNCDTPREREVSICSEGNVFSSPSREKVAESASDGKFSSIGVADDGLEMEKHVPNIEGTIRSPANDEAKDAPEGNAEAGCVEPAPTCTAENNTAGTNEIDVPVCNLRSANEGIVQVKEASQRVVSVSASTCADERPPVQFNSDSHYQKATHCEESIPHACATEKIAEGAQQMAFPDSIPHSAVQIDRDSASVSSVHSADEVGMQIDSDLRCGNASMPESETHAASQAPFDATDYKESIRTDACELKVESASA